MWGDRGYSCKQLYPSLAASCSPPGSSVSFVHNASVHFLIEFNRNNDQLHNRPLLNAQQWMRSATISRPPRSWRVWLCWRKTGWLEAYAHHSNEDLVYTRCVDNKPPSHESFLRIEPRRREWHASNALFKSLHPLRRYWSLMNLTFWSTRYE